MDLKPALAHHFGFNDFRVGQEQTIKNLLANHSSLAIFPTGAGKSLCYQFTATQLNGVTLVVSPLLALIKDQVQFLTSKGVAAASLDSSQTREQNRDTMQAVRQGNIKILMVSVERFSNEGFRHFLEDINIVMLVVDEAHCISEWGHNFRPDYLKLPAYQQQFSIPLVLLLTATATEQVKLDMAAKFAIQAEHIVQTGFYRPNLDLSVLGVPQSQKKHVLLEQVQATTGATIIYTTLQHSAEEVAKWLQDNHIQARAYHAGLSSELRSDIQQAFMGGALDVVVATIAFGMGIDKANIRAVIHYDLPKSIENYSQEIGRAGRDGQPSRCITLANLEGLSTLENFVYGDTPESQAITLLLDNISHQLSSKKQWEMQLLPLSNETNIRQLPLKTLLVQLELMKFLTPKYAYYAQYRYKFIQTSQDILPQFDKKRAAFLLDIFTNTKFKKVWGEPNFEFWALETKERATRALDYLHERGMIELESKQLTQVYDVNPMLDIESTSNALRHYVTDKEHSEIQRIQNLVQFFQQPTCLNSSLSHYFGDNDTPAQCGHCSSCRGESVPALPSKAFLKLEHSTSLDKSVIQQDLAELASAFEKSLQMSSDKMTLDCQCRFFAGISTPYLTKCRAKKLNGFGRYHDISYADLRKTLRAT